MKISNFSKFIGAGLMAASLVVFPTTVFAQTQSEQTQTGTTGNTYEQPAGDVDAVNTDNDSDWGWLGLLGLAGLAGLIPRKRQETVYRTDTEPDVVTRSRSDYR
ncbi:MAG: WGxxGxxG family protein [Cyanobacteriota bacterium]